MENSASKTLSDNNNKDLNILLNEPFINEKGKVLNFQNDSKSNENHVQTALHNHEKGLLFWRKELDIAIEKVIAERTNLESCLASIQHNHNNINSLLESVKKCKDFRIFGNIKGAGNQCDETDKALSEEYQILLSSSQTCVQLGKELFEILRGLKTTEYSLIEDLEKKVSSLETTFHCQSLLRSSTKPPEQIRGLSVIKNVIQDDNYLYHPSNENIPVNIRSQDEGGNWYEEVSRQLQRATDITFRSVIFRNKVKDTCEKNSKKITYAWQEANAKIQLDNKASQAEREKAICFLTHVSNDLSSTRERISTLRGEMEKHTRHLEASLRRVGEYQLKPSSEVLEDGPLHVMKKQCENTAKIITSLESSLEDCREQENKLIMAEKELRKSLERASRVVHTHSEQVVGQRRSTSQSSTSSLPRTPSSSSSWNK